jgi:transposase
VVEELKENSAISKPIKLMFMDEMRFGLISNYRRSWSKIGKRTVIANQQEFSNRYLYSAIDPINGDNFHILGFPDVNASITKIFLDALLQEYKDFHILMVWDNAPFHRKKELHQIDGLTPIYLPSYSPELNPVERFYGEVRKSTANRLFKDIHLQQNIIEDEVVTWMADTEKTKQLCGYNWIIEQAKSFIF